MYNHFYHPSNSSIFFYGNSNISESLKKISDEYLSKYDFESKYDH